MKYKVKEHSWGREYIAGEGQRVIRIYASNKKVTVDLSQARDKEWDVLVKIRAKYPNATKIELAPDTDVAAILRWVGATSQMS